ncbi:biotin--acetyl-CoA-carboxylase ligase [Oscillochloris trichoides DG-6]|uniref:biotin--[biotin carboxyl-carrier protein] ligase n=1 Tax=Oscillochloris trichoides DG-6 TaxID=765420 RepID=E1IG38_9CHLR|nr:biotin--[acetyl-CoA-carboxylase] ligase [Oscillochloris trichoides]EFO79855.1 biotin--acetyl-CoA-carboxylase ligase [Oscillochloris trichoides DG-6]
MQSDALDPNAILTNLGTRHLPRSVACYAEVGSTMDVVRQQIATLPDHALPLLVVADLQTSGRGRLGRSWLAEPGSALLLSLAFRPHWIAPERAFTLVWMAGVALCDAVIETSGLAALLKWPNDLLLPLPNGEYAKAGGILLESSWDGQKLEWVSIGIGVNLHSAPPAHTTRYPTTSLAAVAQQPPERLVLLRSLLRHLDHWYSRLHNGEEASLHTAWQQRLHTLGREVSVQLPHGSLSGYAEAVDADGALHIRDQDGIPNIITSGDVGV